MLIREPKFKLGDYVTDRLGFAGRVENILSYRFSDKNYIYDVSPLDENDNWREFAESRLTPYIKKPKSVWDLKNGDEYYAIDSCGNISQEEWHGVHIDLSYRDTGCAFLTEEEAEFDLERRKIEAQMLRFGGHRKYDYERNNFCFSYDQEKDSVYIYLADFSSAWQPGQGIYFSKRKNAEKALIEIGEDKIIKYLFSIDESGKTDD